MTDNLSNSPEQISASSRQLSFGSRILVIAVVVSSVLLLVVNLSLSVSNHRAAAQIQQLEEKLETLSDFDRRIINLLQQFNNGVQSRLEQQNYDLQGWLGGLDRRLDALEAASHRLAGSQGAGEQETVLRALGLDMQISGRAQPEIVNAPAFLRRDEEEARRTPVPNQPSPASSSYERIEAADGKVYFRRLAR